MFLTPVSLGSTLFFFLSGLTTVYSNQLSHVWLSLKPCVPLLCHVSLYCTNSIQTFCHVSHLLKTETKTILWHIFLLVTILFWTSNELNACVSCLLFFSDPLPGMQSFRGCFLHSDSECSQEEGHSAPLSPTGCLQLFLLTWRDHQAASVTVARTLSFRTLLYLTLE